MKIVILVIVGLTLWVLSGFLMHSLAVDNKKDAGLRHVVLFKFKTDAAAEQIAEVVNAFRELPELISVIQAFEWGTNVSMENRSQGFTHCFLVTFANAADRDSYLTHEAHQAFVDTAGPVLEDVIVVDYQTEK